jgi:hypothetical protein
MVLDDARNKIATHYNFTLDELWPRGSELGPLMRQIRSRLTAEDSELLSNDALTLYDMQLGLNPLSRSAKYVQRPLYIRSHPSDR